MVTIFFHFSLYYLCIVTFQRPKSLIKGGRCIKQENLGEGNSGQEVLAPWIKGSSSPSPAAALSRAGHTSLKRQQWFVDEVYW